MSVRDVLIVGGGPAGLATAIASRHLGLDYLVVEKGTVVDAIYRFPTHMVFFTTPELLEIGGLPLITPYEKPTRLEALRYYRRVVDTYELQVALHEEVHGDRARSATATERIFAVETRSARGHVRRARQPARSCWRSATTTGRTCSACRARICRTSRTTTARRIPYYRQRVVIVGGKNSAAEAALELYRAGAHVTLVHRGAALGESIKYWVKPDIENRIKEGSIAARFDDRRGRDPPDRRVVRPCG